MYSLSQYNQLKKKYGSFASWAIWNDKKESDTNLINENYKQLHSNYVFIGLNISGSLKNNTWSNFHGGKHDRKLKYACDENKLYGSYMTDVFKDIKESKSNKIKKGLTTEIVKKNVDIFNQEMFDIQISNDTQFITLGTPSSMLAQYFNKYFKQQYKNKIHYYYHYSYYKLTDKEWVEGLWKIIGINKNFDLTVKKYKL